MRQKLNYDICMAAGKDAGNRNMRDHKRSQWNFDDWNAAAKIANKLISIMNKKEKVVE